MCPGMSLSIGLLQCELDATTGSRRSRTDVGEKRQRQCFRKGAVSSKKHVQVGRNAGARHPSMPALCEMLYISSRWEHRTRRYSTEDHGEYCTECSAAKKQCIDRFAGLYAKPAISRRPVAISLCTTLRHLNLLSSKHYICTLKNRTSASDRSVTKRHPLNPINQPSPAIRLQLRILNPLLRPLLMQPRNPRNRALEKHNLVPHALLDKNSARVLVDDRLLVLRAHTSTLQLAGRSQ